VTFFGRVPPAHTVDKIVRSSLELAVLVDSSKDILAMAFGGDAELSSNQYSGALVYRAAEKRIMTSDEARPFDLLRHLGYPAEGFNGGEKPVGVKADRFYNRRAQSFWELRDLLEAGQLALPPCYRDQLIRELCAIGWTTTGDRRIQIESKVLIKAKLGGASPDFADALAMCICPDGAIRFDGPTTGPVAF
jgi:hypothetical protein